MLFGMKTAGQAQGGGRAVRCTCFLFASLSCSPQLQRPMPVFRSSVYVWGVKRVGVVRESERKIEREIKKERKEREREAVTSIGTI